MTLAAENKYSLGMEDIRRYFGASPDPQRQAHDGARAHAPYASVFFRGVAIGCLLGGVLGPVSMLASESPLDPQPIFGLYLFAVIVGLYMGGVVAGSAAACALGLHVLTGRISERLRATGATVGAVVGVAIPARAFWDPNMPLTMTGLWLVSAVLLVAAFLAVKLTKVLRT